MWLFPIVVLFQISAISASHPKCGYTLARRGASSGQSTGDESNTIDQPWSVAIVLPKDDGSGGTKLHCSGSILDETTILTAAHCFLGENPEDDSKMTIIVGANQPTNEEELIKTRRKYITTRKIKRVKIHPLYDKNLFSAKYDLALVKIEGRSLKFKQSIWPICIPKEVRPRNYHFSNGYRLVGYGKDINNPGKCGDFECLKEDRLNAQPTEYCSSRYGVILNNPIDDFHDLIKKALPKNFDEEDSLICAGVPGQNPGTCPGDSGGILFKDEFTAKGFVATQQAVVHGSRSKCDGKRYPSIFVRLDNCEVLPWIFENVFPNKQSPTCTTTRTTTTRTTTTRRTTTRSTTTRTPNRPPTPAPPTQTFDTRPTILGDSVILLQTGQTRSVSKSSEILDPSTQQATSCNVEDYPIEVEEAAGDLVGGIPMACGGYQGGSKGPTNKCFKLVAGQWIESGEMSVVRRRHAAIEVTVNGEKALWVTGGYDGRKYLKSTEFVYPDGRVVAGIDLPQRRRSHCMAKLDSTRALIISGFVYEDGKIGGNTSVSTLIYNSEKNSIESGPDLKSARASAACGVFTSSLFRGAPLVMVAGGSGGGSAVETWDYTGSFGAGWQKGPSLPSASFSNGPRLTENGNKDGALITLGKRIYEMKHTPSSPGQKWVRIEPDLKIARKYHLLFSVPLSATGC